MDKHSQRNPKPMKLRKIRLDRLLISGIIYRIHIIIIQSIFWYFFFGITADIWEPKLAVSSSLVWNIVNTYLYYQYHYVILRLVKFGKEDD